VTAPVGAGRATESPRPAPLTGTLGTLGLADLLQLLDLGRKTGVLAVDGAAHGRGLLRLVGGAVTSARFRDAAGTELDGLDDVVAALLALPDGRFSFTADTAARPTPAGAVRVEALLMEAMRRLDEHAPVNAPVDVTSAGAGAPAPAGPARSSAGPLVPILTAGPDTPVGDEPLALGAAEWAVLAAVDGRREAAAVAGAAGLAPERAAAALDALVRLGLVAFVAPAVAAGPPTSPR
jgi:hypothetical protein